MQSFGKVSRPVLLGTAAIVGLAASIGAQAQTEATVPQGESASIDDIVVTANKREQSLNDVGLAVTALSGDALKSQNVSSLADLSRAVPALTFQPTQYSTPVYTLRGVGFYDSSLASYPTVSVYLDEAPQPIPVMTTHTAFDLERVEVLKGPQGTLFGNNSTGGAINFVAKKPTNQFEAGADISYGRFNRVEGNAYAGGPLSSNLNGRLAINGARGDDWQRSQTRPQDRIGEVGYLAGRLLLDWKPASQLRFKLNINGWRETSDPQVPQFVATIAQFPVTVTPLLLTFPFAPRDARYADWGPARPSLTEKMGQVALRTEWDLLAGLTMTAVTSYSGYSRNAAFEQDGTPIANGGYQNATGSIKSFSQEVRLSNEASMPFRWVLGGSYERTNVRESTDVDFHDISAAPIFGFTGDHVSSIQHLRNYAGFANGEYDISHTLTAKAGIRYTKANRAFQNCTTDNGDGTFASVFSNLANAIQFGFVPIAGFTPTGTPVAPLSTTSCAALDNVTFDGTPASYLPGEMRATLNEDNLSWRVGIDVKPADHLLLYGNIARGYKSGSFPFLSGATFEQNKPVTQESILSFEAGAKLQTWNRRISINAAAFLYKYDDKQLRAKIPDPIFGLLESLVNVPKSEIKGIELEFSARPVSGLSLSLAAVYIDSEIKNFSNFSFTKNFTDLSGSRVPYTPKYQVNSTADYKWKIGDLSPFIGATYSWRSSQFTNIGGSRGLSLPSNGRSDYPLQEIFRIKSYGLLDLRAGIEGSDGDWELSIFGKNVLNKYYSTNIQTSFDNVVRFSGKPVTYGVTVKAKIG